MHAANIAGKLVHAFRFLTPLGCSYIEAGSNLDTLPFLAGKGCWMQPSVPLSFVEDCTSVISRLIRGVKLIANNRVNRIDRKRSCSEPFTIGPVSRCIHRIPTRFSGLALHAQLTNHA